MISYLKRKYNHHLDEVRSTIKLLDIEERFDIYFSRFFGFYLAKIGKKLSLTPTHVSLISLAVGLVGGGLLYFQDSFFITVIAGFLIVLAGVLDSADGQLARMTGKSSDFGRVIDGVIDNFVFGSCYIAGTLYFYPIYGWPIFLVASLAAYTHSYKAALYEFYKSEYLLLVGKSRSGYIPLSTAELKPTGYSWYHKIIDVMYSDYTKKQLFYTSRTPEDRAKMQSLAINGDKNFDDLYSSLNRKLLFWWAWISGSNTHRNAIIIASLFGRFDLYLCASLIWTLGVIPLSFQQKKWDKKLLSELSKD